ncbi:hypothetical protein MKW94_025180 [Papaver nudicaule]|uniref:AAA+ ATPase domain-containing protein n=1 Tax=Papaver nudicaule TaxID=74823 RepID=A0AA41RW30_PAPNU|nr:hypothetical protein [Papaver nudicaule]
MGDLWSMGDHWTTIGTCLGSIMFLYTMIERYSPHGLLHKHVDKYMQRILRFTNPSVQISIDEYSGHVMDQKNQSYTYTEAYLSDVGMKSAMQIKAHTPKNSQKLVLEMVDYEMTITDQYHGATFWWMLTNANEIGKPRRYDNVNQRALTLTFHKRYRDIVLDMYLDHVMEKGKEVLAKNQQRRLYTNSGEYYHGEMWSHVVFNHPATFDTLAMDNAKKEDIMEDLIAFSKARDYYAKIGKAWKRGYLLYGPPGTGKSTMIAAISKFMNYDIYDLELKSVKRAGNTELRKLLLETSDRSIIVIEDIDCTLALTDKRKTKKKTSSKEQSYQQKMAEMHGDQDVTLSGLLNFIDGLWSSTGGERLIIITTNHVEKLDPALIRRGRMDMHIELGYCSFEGFKIFAKNYLNIDDHPLFETIRCLINETQITPADVAENLMPKAVNGDDYSDVCLGNLISALEKAKENARLKAEKQSGEEEESEEEEEDEGEDEDEY